MHSGKCRRLTSITFFVLFVTKSASTFGSTSSRVGELNLKVHEKKLQEERCEKRSQQVSELYVDYNWNHRPAWYMCPKLKHIPAIVHVMLVVWVQKVVGSHLNTHKCHMEHSDLTARHEERQE